MLVYAKQTLGATLQLAGFLVVVFSLATAMVIGLDQIFLGFQTFILSWAGLLATLIMATLYVFARRKLTRV